MSVHAATAAVLGGWLAAAGAYHIAAQAALRRLLARGGRRADAAGGDDGPRPAGEPRRAAAPHRAAAARPSATLLRPLDAAAPACEDNLRSLCSLGAPVVVGVEEGEHESAAMARRVAAGDGAGVLKVVVAPGPEGANRKVAKLVVMLKEARGEVFVLSDSDVAVPPDYLDAVLAPFADPGVGVVTCPYRSVGGRSAATRLDVVLTNTGFLPSVAIAAGIEGVRFALGATIAVRREALDAIGGFEPLLDLLADDWALADRARRAGQRIVLAPLLLDHHVDAAGWRTVWRRHLRWARTMRAVRPAGYMGTIVMHGWAPALGLAFLGGGAAAAACVGAYGLVRIGGAAVNARRTGLSTRDLLLLPAADVVAMAVYAGGLLGRTVHWGGERFRLRADGSIRGYGAGRRGARRGGAGHGTDAVRPGYALPGGETP